MRGTLTRPNPDGVVAGSRVDFAGDPDCERPHTARVPLEPKRLDRAHLVRCPPPLALAANDGCTLHQAIPSTAHTLALSAPQRCKRNHQHDYHDELVGERIGRVAPTGHWRVHCRVELGHLDLCPQPCASSSPAQPPPRAHSAPLRALPRATRECPVAPWSRRRARHFCWTWKKRQRPHSCPSALLTVAACLLGDEHWRALLSSAACSGTH